MSMNDDFTRDFIKVVSVLWFVLVAFLVISFLSGCDAGWSVCGWEVK
jgi:hypothetical protein|tara:strand:+ start:153 stop:293 length:141 start_codon:yes stop_codon:yes gene_type:complete